MIDISFLKPPSVLKSRAGMEFLDWQQNNFYKELSDYIKEAYNSRTNVLNLSLSIRTKIETIIKKYTNLTVVVNAEQVGNLAIDAGFITPNSVLNIPGLDGWLNDKYTKVSEAFKALKKDVLKGYCDLRTGKVEGDFKNIEFNLFINVNLPEQYMSKDYIKKSNIPIYEMIAAGILHECGHAFFGLNYLSSTVIDNAMMAQSVKMLINEPDPNRRVVIVKDLKKEMDVNVDEETVKNNPKEKEITVLFEKGLVNRNYRRTLSLGVTQMTSEVLADAYAIRMGASHGLVGLLSSLYNKSFFWRRVGLILISIGLMFIGLPELSIWAGILIIAVIIEMFSSFIGKYVPGTYDTPYRRLKTILRDNIAYLSKNPQGFDKKQINDMIASTKEMEKLIEKEKPFFESTAIQRLLGYIQNGSDFRKTDFEHYTAELVNSNLLLNTEAFN